jgi:unsaturated rhamnogalacturonyl hydrolase
VSIFEWHAVGPVNSDKCLRMVRAQACTAAVTAGILLLPGVQRLHVQEMPMSGAAIAAAAGDSQPDATPLGTLSPKIEHQSIEHAIRLVADWQLKQSEGKYNQDWTYGPLYLGLLAASDATHDHKYHDVVLAQAKQFQWNLWATRDLHADDEAIAQAYEALYAEDRQPERIADARATFDRLVAHADTSDKDVWWWCDALFMAPAGLARVSALTGDRKYLDAMNREWMLTQQHLYAPDQKLFYRDASWIGKQEKNGQPVFWSRGNGWVLAGLVDVLRALPKNDPLRPAYEDLFRQMAQRIASLQQPDGLWRPGLLDPSAYPLPEISGSAFFAYAMTWGVNNGVLSRATFGPVIEKAWSGMLQHVYADGRLGCIQPIGAAPGAFVPSSSYVYGVGAFLLTGKELLQYAKQR